MKQKKTIWQFTNQRELTKSEFLDYFERKVFRTIRKFDMLPKNKIVKLKKSADLNTKVLKHILEKKFQTKFSKKPDFSSENLSQVAEDFFANILKGKFQPPNPAALPKPLYFLNDKEVELYAKLEKLKGKKRKQNKKIHSLFKKLLEKNQDLEQNIIRATHQLK